MEAGCWATKKLTRLIREIANGAWAAVVFVDFRRSPEAQYPAVLEEAYAAVKYIAENGKQLQLDTTRIAIAGDSAGGNLAIAVTLLAKERKGPRIGYQVLFYPVTDANFDTSSYHEFAADHFLTREAMKWFWNQYAPEAAARKQITASPLRASIDQLVDLPSALVITGECDVLRDEGEAYASKLTAAGVRVTAVRCLCTIHDFVTLNAVTISPQTRAAIALASSHLQTFFGK